ncbi:hypothetical protein F5Y11DRAFT_323425 [Daldinia sp. FL1419]|nr:hypothetical protein F5Y11DRAFT_323425 [Daldinia sp. FL1419]
MPSNIVSSSRPLASRVPGQLHTPTHSFSEAALTPDSSEAKSSNWNDKRSREELDLARAKLADQKFNMRDYDDPLLPRQHRQAHYYPKGVTAGTEANLLKLIAEFTGSSR